MCWRANKSYLLPLRKKKSFAGEFEVLLPQAISKHARPTPRSMTCLGAVSMPMMINRRSQLYFDLTASTRCQPCNSLYKEMDQLTLLAVTTLWRNDSQLPAQHENDITYYRKITFIWLLLRDVDLIKSYIIILMWILNTILSKPHQTPLLGMLLTDVLGSEIRNQSV